jgi:hypothetical protein
VGGVLLFGTYFEHYTLPLLAPFAAGAAFALGDRRFGLGVMTTARAYYLPFFLFVPLFGLVVQEMVFSRNVARSGDAKQFYALADWVKARLRPGDCIYLHDGDPLLYREAGNCVMTRWNFPAHLDNIVEAEALGIDPVKELRRVMSEKPRLVIINARPPDNIYPPSRQFMLNELRRNWRAVHVARVGKNHRVVYEPASLNR